MSNSESQSRTTMRPHLITCRQIALVTKRHPWSFTKRRVTSRKVCCLTHFQPILKSSSAWGQPRELWRTSRTTGRKTSFRIRKQKISRRNCKLVSRYRGITYRSRSLSSWPTWSSTPRVKGARTLTSIYSLASSLRCPTCCTPSTTTN